MRYFPMKFQKKTMMLLNVVKGILENSRDLLPLTVRQIFYQVISKEDSPLQNTEGHYHKLGKLLVNARYCGEISFEDIEDRTRHTYNLPITLDDIMLYYYPEAWQLQKNYVEVFVEKEGLRDFFTRTLRSFYVPVTPIRGFDSLSNVERAAKRLYKYRDRQRLVFIFSDFDPSGECLSHDFEFRLKKQLVMFGEDTSLFDEENKSIKIPNINCVKTALTLEQVEKYNLPPKYAKVKDPRAPDFIKKYGEKAVVELDALPPDVLEQSILEAVLPCLDLKEVERNQKKQQRISSKGAELLQEILDDSDNIGEDR